MLMLFARYCTCTKLIELFSCTSLEQWEQQIQKTENLSLSSLSRQDDHQSTPLSATCVFSKSLLLRPQCLKNKDSGDGVHASFAELLSELNKSDAPYALSVANRLYGEQSYQFVEVRVFLRFCARGSS